MEESWVEDIYYPNPCRSVTRADAQHVVQGHPKARNKIIVTEYLPLKEAPPKWP